MNQRRKQRLERQYEAKLDALVDDIYNNASDQHDWSWTTLADQACLSYNTVYRLGMRITRLPRLQTVYKLAVAVGMDINLLETTHGIRLAA